MTDQAHPIQVEPWITRARAVQEAHGAITPQQIVSAEDLAALEQAHDLMAALMVLFIENMPRGLADDMFTATAHLRWQVRELTDPEQNWNEGHTP
jgi:hypothetical protein